MAGLLTQLGYYIFAGYVVVFVAPFLIRVKFRRTVRYRRLPLMKDIRVTVGLTLAAFLLLPQREFKKAHLETGISFSDWFDDLVDRAAQA